MGKKIKCSISIVLLISLLFCSCGKDIAIINSNTYDSNVENNNKIDSIEVGTNDIFANDAIEIQETTDTIDTEVLNENVKNDIGDITFSGLDDEALLDYVEDNIYEELVSQLNSEEYFVENVEALYYPKEYIEALAANSSSNIYFGYTSEELNNQFAGVKYVFTLGEDGQTTVVPMDTVNDDVYVKAMEDVIVGTGVIVICVTVSVLAPESVPAVSMIFTASAKTGTIMALSSGGIGFAASAIAKGYETESFDEAMKAAIQSGSDNYKWGAITGVLVGGGEQAIALKGATLNGLSMNEAAKIQKESNFPLDLIKQFKSYDEYEIYKNAGLYTKMVNGKLALVRNIDLDYVSELPNGELVTNLARMKKGYAPIDPATGKYYQLHHVNQDPNGTLAILTESEHQGNASILNLFGKESEINRTEFEKTRREFWKKLAASFQ